MVVAVFLGADVLLYRSLVKRVARNALDAGSALLLFWAFLAAAPLVLAGTGVLVASLIYFAFPAVRPSSWDVGLVFVATFSVMLCYALASLSAVIVTWKFIVKGKRTRLT